MLLRLSLPLLLRSSYVRPRDERKRTRNFVFRRCIPQKWGGEPCYKPQILGRRLYLTTGIIYMQPNSMEQNSSRETDSHSASQEIPHLLRNPKVHKSQPIPKPCVIFRNKLFLPCIIWIVLVPLAFHSGREADHSPPSSAEVKEWVELCLHSPMA